MQEMNVEINPELLAIILLNRLPPSFDNFQRTIERQDELLSLNMLQKKIVEEIERKRRNIIETEILSKH